VIKVLLADDHSIVRAGLRRVVEESGDMVVVAEATESLALRAATGARGESLLDTLSNREIQVLRSLALGKTTREIGEGYNISVKTVDTYRYRLLQKLNLRNNAELTRFAIQNRLVEP